MAEFRLLQDRDKEQASALWQECFGDSDGFCRWFMSEQWNGEYSIAAVEEGKLVSMIHGRPYTLCIRGCGVPSVIMCGVATAPAYRHRGLMRRCMELFERNARDKGAFVLFQSPVDFRIYEWCMQYPSSASGMMELSEKARLRGSCYAVDSACDDSFAAELLPLYNDVMRNCSGRVMRTLANMQNTLRGYQPDGGRLLRYIKEGKTLGYALYYGAEKEVNCIEFMARGRAARGLLSTLGAMARGRRMMVRGTAELLLMGVPKGIRGSLANTTAMGALNVPGLLHELAGFDDVTVEVTDSVIPENNGVFTFGGKPSKGPVDIKMDSGRLMQLLCGYADIAQLEGQEKAEIVNRLAAHKLLDRLPTLQCFTAEEY